MMKISIVGAGAIGCFVGAHWARDDTQITLIGRDKILRPIQQHGLSQAGEPLISVPAGVLKTSSDCRSLGGADVIVLCTKATALDALMADLSSHAADDTPIVSLLNGVEPVRRLRARFPNRRIIAGMVPFNVVWQDQTTLHRTGAGRIALEQCVETTALAGLAQDSGAPIQIYDDIEPIQYGKLLLNLVNPINALSGLTLYKMLSQRTFRDIYRAVLQEALTVYAASGVNWQKASPFTPAQTVRLLRLPDWIFQLILLRIQKIDPKALTSMASDVAHGRKTEIDYLNGEIVRLAQASGVNAPLNAALVDIVSALRGPVALSATELGKEMGL